MLFESLRACSVSREAPELDPCDRLFLSLAVYGRYMTAYRMSFLKALV